jgi:hypothetical protein
MFVCAEQRDYPPSNRAQRETRARSAPAAPLFPFQAWLGEPARTRGLPLAVFPVVNLALSWGRESGR